MTLKDKQGKAKSGQDDNFDTHEEELDEGLDEGEEELDEELDNDSDEEESEDDEDSDGDPEDEEESEDDDSEEIGFQTVAEALASPEGLKAIKSAEDRVRTKLYKTKIKPAEKRIADLEKQLQDAGVTEKETETTRRLKELEREVAKNRLSSIRQEAIKKAKGRIIPELIVGDTEEEIEASIQEAKDAYKAAYSSILNRLKAEGWEKKEASRSKKVPKDKELDAEKREELSKKFGLDRMRRVARR